MTPEEFERISDVLSRLYERDPEFRTSKSFPEAQHCLSGDSGIPLSAIELNNLHEHVINGNPCKIIDYRKMPTLCKCFSVGDWLYFAQTPGGVCLYRVTWDQVEFLDKDLIQLHPAGEGGEAQ